ncbi:uncharacterized protein LOC129234248 [Uloborus diversus]|uniref:uncharacterized protein LOC129234248 n=1 Tax=Uloborus diversus TaxID=327109 RepID=UPI0024099FD8|nr:uncharacterized protein LOC129234248 [Uloborus diversus]
MSKRSNLSISEKQKICEYKQSCPNTSQQSISSHFSIMWKKPISRRCIGDILCHKERWFNVDDARMDAIRMKSAKHEKLEDALYTWIMQMTAKNATITGDTIREHAKIFGQQMNITDFEHSNGWLNRFKKRRGLSQHIRSGETANVDPTIATKGREKLRAIISQYAVADVYNMDESGLFYRLQPDKILSNGAVKGCKKAKDRVSLVFCTNVDGSDKRTVSVIGKAAKPRCFKNFNPALYVDYDSHPKSMDDCHFISKMVEIV